MNIKAKIRQKYTIMPSWRQSNIFERKIRKRRKVIIGIYIP